MFSKTIAILLGGIALLLAAPGAQAAYIDFTSPYWQPAGLGYKTSFTNNIPGTTDSLTLSASGPHLFIPPDLTWDGTDGIGIDNIEDFLTESSDEIDHEWYGGEKLTVTFGTTYTMTSFTVSDLFNERRGFFRPRWYRETGKFRTYNEASGWSAWGFFTAPTDNVPRNPVDSKSKGFFTVDLLSDRQVDKIEFMAATFQENGYWDNDFSLAGINADPEVTGDAVPEPGTIILFGSAAGILGFMRRRKQRQAK